jgi:hypothetical protein
MAKNILFTNDPELLAADPGFTFEFEGEERVVDEIRPARGKNSFQVDALYYREDGTAAVLTSIPNYTEHQGRTLYARGSVALPEFPECLLPYVGNYEGQTRDLRDKDTGKVIRNPDGSVRKGHNWVFEGRNLVTALQLKEGFVIAMVGDPEESTNQPKDRTAPRNYTVRMQVMYDENCTFSPWSSEGRMAVTTDKVEGKIRLNLTKKAAPAEAPAQPAPKLTPKRGKKAADSGELMF